MHHRVKGFLWKSKAQDTFETQYKMNQRPALNAIMTEAGFVECSFRVLADASLFWRIPFVRRLELGMYKLASRIGLPYIDTCILAVYRRA